LAGVTGSAGCARKGAQMNIASTVAMAAKRRVMAFMGCSLPGSI
jgi:hypothetical protein